MFVLAQVYQRLMTTYSVGAATTSLTMEERKRALDYFESVSKC